MTSLQFLIVRLIACILIAVFSACDIEGAEDTTDPDKMMLRESKIKTDTPSLVAFLNKLVDSRSDLANIERLIKDLGDDSFKVRQHASEKLIALRLEAIPALR